MAAFTRSRARARFGSLGLPGLINALCQRARDGRGSALLAMARVWPLLALARFWPLLALAAV
eukprot:CAMPEP_0119304854 /NCGR_PEP_ID=MMETSP1333-20130426/5974_1 /TAXON_ID=418940 /ORGANISM="Scyphosphaera apsteinii, Strain RCC1455" /LENGTH=61 /DNA_ID=CAMNT_0007307805 /DNA_START=603 /DNA_END=788 /DNA_ORIENTATION=+